MFALSGCGWQCHSSFWGRLQWSCPVTSQPWLTPAPASLPLFRTQAPLHTKRICIASLCLMSQSTSQRMASEPLGVSSPCKPKFLPQDSRIPRSLILSMTHEVAKSQDEFVQESQTACDSRPSPSLLLCEPHQHDKFCCTQTRHPWGLALWGRPACVAQVQLYFTRYQRQGYPGWGGHFSSSTSRSLAHQCQGFGDSRLCTVCLLFLLYVDMLSTPPLQEAPCRVPRC